MIISRSDAKQLAERAQLQHDQAASRRTGELMRRCKAEVFRSLADGAEAYRICRASGCRRARRCAGGAFHCRTLVWRLRSDFDRNALIEDLYFRELQRLVDEAQRQR